jgi:hemerythrin
MDLISWDHTLKIGNARIDAEHKELADFLARTA